MPYFTHESKVQQRPNAEQHREFRVKGFNSGESNTITIDARLIEALQDRWVENEPLASDPTTREVLNF